MACNIKELETFIKAIILSPGKLINEKFIKSELDKVKEQLKMILVIFQKYLIRIRKFFKNADISRYSDAYIIFFKKA